MARRAARHRRARRWPTPRHAEASSSSPATASSTASTSRRATCGLAFRRSRCSTSSRASASSRPRREGVRPRPEPTVEGECGDRAAGSSGRIGWLNGASCAGCIVAEEAERLERRDKTRSGSREAEQSMSTTLDEQEAAVATRSAAGPAGARRDGRCARRRWPTTSARSAPASKAAATSRSTENDLERIHEAVLTVLETIGFANAIPSCIEALTRAGAILGADGRLRFPRAAGARHDQERGAAFHAARPGPQARHADPGHARCITAPPVLPCIWSMSRSASTANRCCRTSTTPRASSTGSTTSISSSGRWCRATFPIRWRWISTRSTPA